MKKNIILITGGAGFIGSNLISEILKKYKYKIISLDNYSSGSKKNHIDHKRVKYIKGDTNDIDKICNKFKYKILAIFHFGEFARIHQSFEYLEECFNSNINGTEKVINFCKKNKIKIIYSATSAALGNNGKDKNLSPYSFSKSTNLNLILNFRKWFGLSYEIVYFFNVYGKNQICTGRMATVIGIFENQFKKDMPLTIVKPGTQTRRFTHVDDTISGCIYAWKKNKNSEYLLSHSKSYSVVEVAKMFSNKIKFLPPRNGERYKSVLVKKILGRKINIYRCNITLVDYVENIKNKLNK